jgi:iron complex transport system substrate-binding protein
MNTISKNTALTLLFIGIAAGCSERASESTAPHPRLITYSPAITKIVFDMGLGEHVVGVTNFCQLPPGQHRPVVGDNLNVRVEQILSVQPDIILAQIEEKKFAALREVKPDIRIEDFLFDNLQDIADAMQRIGEIVNQPEIGNQARSDYLQRLDLVRQKVTELPKRKVIFVMDYKAPTGAGRNTFVHEMIELSNGINLLAENYDGWKKISLESILVLDPEVVICYSEENQAEDTLKYWQSLAFTTQGERRFYVVTDSDWLIPAGHLAQKTIQLAGMIHPQLSEGDCKP